MTDGIDTRFRELYRDRATKPRETGITAAIGECMQIMGRNTFEDMVEVAGAWLDWYKFMYTSAVVQSPWLVQQKLAMLNFHRIQALPDGNFLEIAVAADQVRTFLDGIKAIGFPRIEVSRTEVGMSLEEKVALIDRARSRGFDVVSRIGNSQNGHGPSQTRDSMIQEMQADLEAGADYVIVKADQPDRTLDQTAFEGFPARADAWIDRIESEVGTDRVIFAAPRFAGLEGMAAIGWLIERLGPDVNLGNVSPHYLNMLEQQRRGIGPFTATY